MKANVSLILDNQLRLKEKVMLTKTLCRYTVCAAVALVASFSWLAGEGYGQKGEMT